VILLIHANHEKNGHHVSTRNEEMSPSLFWAAGLKCVYVGGTEIGVLCRTANVKHRRWLN
jgi:hypothetical protein